MLVALLAEGVDRNNQVPRLDITRSRSPSSRRAWIEILPFLCSKSILHVALLAEGVDRNSPLASFQEMLYVALLAEGVDRNSKEGASE